jgi:glycerol-3-phosphate dehydrogenase subunit B
MPGTDVVVIGAGLAGLTCAAGLAERGARVVVAAKGMATTHWTHGGLDVAAPPGAATAAEGVRELAARDGHPFALVGADVADAVAAHLARLARAGLAFTGSLAARLRPIPTAIGALRPASILPDAQAAALEPWSGEGLLLVGYRRYRDAWAPYAARNLGRIGWADGPTEIRAVEVELPDLVDLHNLNARSLGLQFDRPAWRARALAAVAANVPPGRWRVGVPPTLGIADHVAALADARAAIGQPVFEIPSLPPSVPGLRLFEALRACIIAGGGRLQLGNDVVRAEVEGARVRAIHTAAAVRTLRLAADEFVLATGGIGGDGIRARPDGTLVERVFGLPVTAPPREAWFGDGALDAHPIETLGIGTDEDLRPLGRGGERSLENVRVIGSALAGMHYLRERCGDGVAVASAHRVARDAAIGRNAA